MNAVADSPKLWWSVRSRIEAEKPILLSIVRPSVGEWWIDRSSTGITAGTFDVSADKPVAADYTGDGRTDFAVYRNGTWYVFRSTQGFYAAQFRATTDSPVPAK